MGRPLSGKPFCQGLPGSINAVPMPCATIQDNSPGQQRLRHELLGPLSLRRNIGVPVYDEPGRHLDDARGANAAADIDGQSFLGELVRDGEALELLAVGAMIGHEVVGPDLVRTARRSRSRPRRGNPLLWPLAWHLQSCRPPQSMRGPGLMQLDLAPEKDADAAIAIARILRRQLLHSLD